MTAKKEHKLPTKQAPGGEGGSCSEEAPPPHTETGQGSAKAVRTSKAKEDEACQYVGHTRVGDGVRVVVRSLQRHSAPYVDTRLYYFMREAGMWVPSRRGWRLPANDTEELAATMVTACDVARGKQTPLAPPEDIVI